MNRVSSIEIVVCLVMIYSCSIHGNFVPNINDYDAYGLKITMNEQFLIQARGGDTPPRFLVQSAPYNSTTLSSSQCWIAYPNSNYTYIYSVGIGKRQNQSNQNFFFNGEYINGQNGTFIGMGKYNGNSSTCDTQFSFFVSSFTQYQHAEYYILGVTPTGRLAYGFSNEFLLLFDSLNPASTQSWSGNITWRDPSFLPHAVDMSDNFGVIAGFIQTIQDTVVKYLPTIYLLNFNSTTNRPIIVDEYRPNATPNTWQDLLTNADAYVYSPKYDMSVSISRDGNILVGMQFINRVFLLSVNTSNPNQLNFISRYTNGRSLGYGKGLTWLDNGIAAILANTYSLDYEWSSSELHFYDIGSYWYNSSSTPLSIFPNNYQLLPSRASDVFLNVVSSPISLTLMDENGNLLIFIPTAPGFYPSFDEKVPTVFSTRAHACLAGTYKSQTGIYGCLLCPSDMKNPGNSSQQCVPCSNGSFCPLGSVADVSPSALTSTVQIMAYPQSPESIIFDEILIQNMFHISGGRCLVISPLFWTLIVAGLAIMVIIFMGILTIYMDHPRHYKIRQQLKCIFRHTDLIGEGELWVGGLASFAVIVMVCFAYSFSNQYYHQYPIETTSDSNFACDLSLRNAKFETGTQSLAIPFSANEQPMATLLNNQNFILNIDFINTLIKCDAVSLQALYGTKWSTIRWLNCDNTDAILSLSIPLPFQHLSVQVSIADVKTIGALRLGLYGDEHEVEQYSLKQLNFNQSFSKYGQILAQSLPISLGITKVINETLIIESEESYFTGIYIPTFEVDINSLFVSNDQYVRSNQTSTVLTLILTETPYYVKNLQQPIAKRSEIIFHNLLFTIVCLEIFGLIFVLYKLILKPLHRFACPHHYERKKKKSYTFEDSHSSINMRRSNERISTF